MTDLIILALKCIGLAAAVPGAILFCFLCGALRAGRQEFKEEINAALSRGWHACWLPVVSFCLTINHVRRHGDK